MSLDAAFELARDDFRLVLDLRIEPGETVALVGPNGAGKSTVVRVVTGLERVTSGRVELDGRVLDDATTGIFVEPHERRIGTAFQEPLLFPHLDVAGNVAFRLPDRRSASAAQAVTTWLDRVGLSGFGERSVGQLSGGEARRVTIARALIGDPKLVVLDEPFAGLDVAVHAGVRRMLHEQMREYPAPRLLITHDAADAQALADRMFVLEGGRVTQRGTPDEIRQRPATRYVADLVGTNLLRGVARSGSVSIDGGLELTVADRSASGDVMLTVAPHALALHRDRPAGSPRNSWRSTVGGVHAIGDVVRVQLDAPVEMVADVTPGAVDDLDLAPGREVWVAVKATSLDVNPAD